MRKKIVSANAFQWFSRCKEIKYKGKDTNIWSPSYTTMFVIGYFVWLQHIWFVKSDVLQYKTKKRRWHCLLQFICFWENTGYQRPVLFWPTMVIIKTKQLISIERPRGPARLDSFPTYQLDPAVCVCDNLTIFTMAMWDHLKMFGLPKN